MHHISCGRLAHQNPYISTPRPAVRGTTKVCPLLWVFYQTWSRRVNGRWLFMAWLWATRFLTPLWIETHPSFYRRRIWFLLLKGPELQFSKSVLADRCPTDSSTLSRNMTWNGFQGFQTPIELETFHVQNMGTYGNMHTERNLTCTWRCAHFEVDPFLWTSNCLSDVEFYYSGHMTPRTYFPNLAHKH